MFAGLALVDTFKSSNYFEHAQRSLSGVGRVDARRTAKRDVSEIEVGGLAARRYAGRAAFVGRLAGESAKTCRRSELDEVAAELSPHDPINIQYTSGTTGNPKGAMLSHRNILLNGFYAGDCQRLTEKDRVCMPVPLYHCFGCVLGTLCCVAHGSAMVFPGREFSTRRDARGDRAGTMHGAVRRAHDVHCAVGARGLSRGAICRRCGRGSCRAARARSRR